MSGKAKPIKITRDSLTVKIYQTPNKANPDRPIFHLVYRQGGERKRIVSRDLEALKARAEEVLNDLASGKSADVDALTSHQRETFTHLEAIAREVGIAPLIAMRHFV